MSAMNCNRLWTGGIGRAALTLSVVMLAACATAPRSLPPPAAAAAVPEPATVAQVFVYPAAGQSAAQLDRDRYECHLWAVKQSSFDPSSAQLAPHQRVQVVTAGPPPGTNTVAGAATGAVIGAVVSRPRQAGEGALVGAVAGAILGASADAANQQRTEAIQRRYDQRDLHAQARLELQARDYRRAISACLEGRGYTVK
jgi:hypothetical protein